MLRSFLSIVLVSIFCTISLGQSIPVKWTFDYEKVGDKKYLLKLSADIEKDWVLYSQHIEEGGPVPTGFFFTESESYNLIGSVEEKSKSHTEMDELFEMEVIKFKTKAEFEQLVEVQAEDVVVNGELEFMTCDGNKCLPPTTVEFSFDLK